MTIRRSASRLSVTGILISTWGIAGVALVILRALVELTPIALEILGSSQLEPWHWVVLVSWIGINAYAEGYAGFHCKFSPRTVDRALFLGSNPTFVRVVFAAPFCTGLFAAPRRAMIASWTLVVGILVLVLTVGQLAQPWRGIIDAGVVVGLSCGLVSLLGLYVQAIFTDRQPVRHDVPGS